MQLQGQFDFGVSAQDKGYSQWLAGRQLATETLARRLGLPLGHQVEVILRGDIRLRGRLRLKEEALMIEEEAVRHLELQIDRVPFRAGELESCVRLD